MLSERGYAELSFSRVGDIIYGVGNPGLVAISPDGGMETLIAYTDNGILAPDPSHDGLRIVYARLGKLASEPPDSAGIHIVEIASGTDSVLTDPLGNVLIGNDPEWSPGDTAIVFVTQSGLSIIALPSRILRTIADAPAGTHFVKPHWLNAGNSILASLVGSTTQSVKISLGSNTVQPYPFYLGPIVSYSPADSAAVFSAEDPTVTSERVAVLFVRPLSGTGTGILRRLTSY